MCFLPKTMRGVHSYAEPLFLLNPQLCRFRFLQKALAEAAERARELQMFVAMAPEGTRSKTGQLGPFKKVSMGSKTCTGRSAEWGGGVRRRRAPDHRHESSETLDTFDYLV